jgi:hypothetical protein
MPHRGFHLTSVYSITEAARHIIGQLYGELPPAFPRYFKDTTQKSRNLEIHRQFETGESVPNLAREFGISEQRVHQILRGKRK